MSPGNSYCRCRLRASSPPLSGIMPGADCVAGFGRCSSFSLSILRCRFCWTREGNSRGVFIVSLNEYCAVAFTFLRRRRRSDFRRMNAGAFGIIAVFTLAGALAAATLPNLMHAALCFVIALLGLASFFFLLGAEFVGLAL